MIVRMWRGQANTANADAYEHFVTTRVFAALPEIEGHRGAYLSNRCPGGDLGGEDVEFIAITLWDSVDAIRSFAGDNIAIAPWSSPKRAPCSPASVMPWGHFELAYGMSSPQCASCHTFSGRQIASLPSCMRHAGRRRPATARRDWRCRARRPSGWQCSLQRSFIARHGDDCMILFCEQCITEQASTRLPATPCTRAIAWRQAALLRAASAHGAEARLMRNAPRARKGSRRFCSRWPRRKRPTSRPWRAIFVRRHRPSSLLQRFATIEEVANMVVYAAAPQASATNGASMAAWCAPSRRASRIAARQVDRPAVPG